MTKINVIFQDESDMCCGPIIEYSTNPPIAKSITTIPTSIAVGMICFFNEFRFTTLQTKRKLRDMPMEYAASSSMPKGETRTGASGDMPEIAGLDTTNALNAAPVCHPVNEPHTIPNAGTNIGRATEEL